MRLGLNIKPKGMDVSREKKRGELLLFSYSNNDLLSLTAYGHMQLVEYRIRRNGFPVKIIQQRDVIQGSCFIIHYSQVLCAIQVDPETQFMRPVRPDPDIREIPVPYRKGYSDKVNELRVRKTLLVIVPVESIIMPQRERHPERG